MLNEAVRCLDDGIIASPRDGDIGAIFGIGFPPFLGGPFSYMDKLGASNVSSEMATFANYNAVFTPCDTLISMADKGASFYQVEPAVIAGNEAQEDTVESSAEDAIEDVVTEAPEAATEQAEVDEKPKDEKVS